MALRPETRARARALQLLYAWETDGRPPLDALLPGVARLTRPGPSVLELATELACGVIERRAELDELFARAAEHWRVERLAVIDRNILRLGAFELLTGRTPPRVAIDQALWLAHRFGGRESPAFINGVLDAVARGLGRL
ncbi:MAG: transcription antitermination factor NusB [Gemmatimonadales bacterium]